MIHFFGYLSLYLAFACAFVQTVCPLIGLRNNQPHLLACGRSFAIMQFLCIFCAYALLTAAFLIDDFSLAYVAANSHQDLPLVYKITAAWGAHEGSVLFWMLVLSGWTVLFTFLEKISQLKDISIITLGILSLCFLSFLIWSSNPFLAIPFSTGSDLNPLLQDAGFVIHPPMLYIGYVVMCVPFAYTIAGLLTDNLGPAWARRMRFYVIAPWAFLTLGITLGSWWAYRVLGWGGFWFWDPVENASLLPWLAATALLHVLLIVEKKSNARSWAALLAIVCFTLSVLGTFLVRSGILVSTHTFANDPKRGLFLLVLLGLVACSAFVIFVTRTAKLSHAINPSTSWISKESALILNSLLLVTALMTILVGTLYPLIMDALHLGSISVGAPYFNTVLLPLLLFTLFAMGMVPFLTWEGQSRHFFSLKMLKTLSISFILGFIIIYLTADPFSWISALCLSLACWVICSLGGHFKKSFSMTLAHTGFAVLCLGVILSGYLSIHKEVRMRPGNATEIGPYQFFFLDTKMVKGTNYQGISAIFEVMKGKHHVINLYPEKRIYSVREMVMTNVDIHPGLFRDLYLALGQPLDHGYWSVRIDYKPFVRWIWAGGLLMVLSSLITWFNRHRRTL